MVHFDRDQLTINQILSKRALLQPDKLAYRFLRDGETQEEPITYAQLENKSLLIAGKISSLRREKANKKAKQLGLLLYPSGLEFICSFFACLHSNTIAVPSSLPQGKRGKARIENIIKTANIDYILTDSATRQSLIKADINWGNADWIVTDLLSSSSSERLAESQTLEIPEEVAFIQYTSGSTSFPKGVVITHRNLIANEAMIEKGFGHSDATRFVGWLPFFHDMGLIGNILQPMYLGIEATLMSPLSFLQKPIRWLEAISRYGATTSGAPNFAFDLCVEKGGVRGDLDLSKWCVAFSGSEPVQAGTLSRFYQAFSPYGFRSSSFYPCYGLAEATLFVSGNGPAKLPVIKNLNKEELETKGLAKPAVSNDEKVSSYVSVGHSWNDQKIRIVDPNTLASLPPNAQGEIWLQGENIASDYWNDLEATKETFQNELRNESGYFLRTGDLGFIDENGLLYITSRLKDLIIIRGRNISPQDIEISIIESDSAFNINGCAAFSITCEDQEKLIVVAEIKREFLRDFKSEALLAHVKKTLAQEHSVEAKEIVFVKPNSIPKTSSGKVQRGYCKKLFLSRELDMLTSSDVQKILL
jgi:acyl-CoA synthetase (AMP-forming)/AMP-acid ligase II